MDSSVLERRPVAYLDVIIRDGDRQEKIDEIAIFRRDDFYLGRRPDCRRSWSLPDISHRQLRIYCVLYEEDDVSGIAPLVYAKDLSRNGTHMKTAANHEFTAIGTYMGRRNTALLLSHGDTLTLNHNLSLVFRQPQSRIREVFSKVQIEELKTFSEQFLVSHRRIGAGGHGSVYLALHRQVRRQLACKIIDLPPRFAQSGELHQVLKCFNIAGVPSISKDAAFSISKAGTGRIDGYSDEDVGTVKNYFREFAVLKDLSHPNIITLDKVYYSTNTIYMFQELITGGDLFSYLERKGGRLWEGEAALIVRQILTAIQYLHDRNIVHRDLKPDNILMASTDAAPRIIVTDFGNARHLPTLEAPVRQAKENIRMTTVVGTLEYAAPEIHRMNKAIQNEGYSKAVDMWSIGVITASLLGGDVLFTNRQDPEYDQNPKKVILNLSSRCDLSVLDRSPTWMRIGQKPKDFIRRLLVLDEDLRMTANKALKHPWFTQRPEIESLYEAVYRRTVKGWQPARRRFRVIQQIHLDNRLCSSNGERAKAVRLPNGLFPFFFRAVEQEKLTPAKRPPTALPTIAEYAEEELQAVKNELFSSSFSSTSQSKKRKAPLDPTKAYGKHSIGFRISHSTSEQEYQREQHFRQTDSGDVSRKESAPSLSQRTKTPRGQLSEVVLIPETPIRATKLRYPAISFDGSAEFKLRFPRNATPRDEI